ncbi:hypothetical protein EZS27_024285 [termite gut metagenome]|uniref:Uncharacterized protein n=1 Tax=termite gut metagenome TaxID=433724 RepID=A0A5J4QY69_9ZZZZ
MQCKIMKDNKIRVVTLWMYRAKIHREGIDFCLKENRMFSL